MDRDTDQEMDRDSIVPDEGALPEADPNRETQGDQTVVEIGQHFEGAPEMVCTEPSPIALFSFSLSPISLPLTLSDADKENWHSICQTSQSDWHETDEMVLHDINYEAMWKIGNASISASEKYPRQRTVQRWSRIIRQDLSYIAATIVQNHGWESVTVGSVLFHFTFGKRASFASLQITQSRR